MLKFVSFAIICGVFIFFRDYFLGIKFFIRLGNFVGKLPPITKLARQTGVALADRSKFGAKLVLHSCWLALCGFIFSFSFFNSDFFAACLAALLLACLPLTANYSKLLKRKELILAEFPYLLDLLSLALQAGMSLLQGLIATQEALPNGPLKSEIEHLLDQLRHGEELSLALDNFAKRSGLEEVSAFSQAVIAAKALGAELSQTIYAQAELQRSLSFARQEKRAQTAPVRMMLPLFLFIFPTIVLMILAPIYLSYFMGQTF